MKPNCRDCPSATRELCIQACSVSPSIKLTMRRAFAAGRDTQQMWATLQENCLLFRQEEQVVKTPRLAILMRRLKGKPVGANKADEGIAASSSTAVTNSAPFQSDPIKVREAGRELAPVQTGKAGGRESFLSRYCLALRGGQHRISLPAQCEIVLGRFDPMTNVTPDVDLSYDDRENRLISRRHARVIGLDGQHQIEDLGSTNGTRVNGRRLKIGQKVQLQPGDQVVLGRCTFAYVPMAEAQISPLAVLPQAYLRVTFTGHRFPLPSLGESIIGRSDNVVGFIPDIDLSRELYAAQVVARRHVKLIARDGRHYVEDLGSAYGTKLNGVCLELGERSLLNPGDHLWLGGCVLAYDIEI